MVGNDVVDLADAEVRGGPRHPRFDERVHAPEERRCIAAAGPGAPLRWILWAAKEAAYKLARRRDQACIFSPPRFVVALDGAFDTELDAESTGSVRHADVSYPVRVTLKGDCVHAVVTAPGCGFDGIAANTHPLGDAVTADAASRAVRAFAIADLARRLEADAATLAIHSRQRIPQLQLPAGPTADLSLSHHGRFVAYACAIPPARPETPR